MESRAALILPILALFACSSETTGLDSGVADAGASDAASVACGNDDACPSDQFCSEGSCTPGTGNACTETSGCTPDEICQLVTECGATRCHGNVCVPKICTEPSDCRSGVCDEGECAPAASCATDPCAEGFECVDEVCVRTGCERDSDCEGDDICVRGACGAPDQCNDSSDCGEGLVCQIDTCREPCAVDDDCGTPAVAWQCTQGVCERRCIGDATCPGGFVCKSRICEAADCTVDGDCGGPTLRCAGGPAHGRCEEFTPCTVGGSECPENFQCENNACIELPTCISDRSCDATSYCENAHCQPSQACGSGCPSGSECVGELCVPKICRSNADCLSTELCLGGSCATPPSAQTVIEIRILTPAGYVRPGETRAFVAVALDPAGQVVPGVAFNWRSSTVEVASIASTGMATGGMTAGETFITASADNGSSIVTSVPVSLVNLGPLTTALRVTVSSLSTGSPVAGAKVVAGGMEVTTDAVGSATLEGVTFPTDVTVAHANYDYVTLIGVGSNSNGAADIGVPLPSITRRDRVAGLKGSVDLSGVTETGPLSASLSGASFASPLFAFLEPAEVFGGEQFTVTVTPPGGNGFSFPMAANATLEADVFGTPFSIKDTFYTRARAGARSAWCFGGRLGDGDLGDALRQLSDGPAGLLPFLQNFRHAVRPFQPVLALPTIVDASDVNGNGDVQESVPDYASFPSVSFRPTTEQNLRYALRSSGTQLPFVFGGIADTLIIMSGAILPGTGFVPLGFDGFRDENRTGIAPDLVTRMAPPHGGLESGEPAVVVIAVRTEGTQIPGPGAAQLFVGSPLPTTVDLSTGWIPSPTGGSISGRALSQPIVAGADVLHATFFAPEGAWHVYWPASRPSVSLPAAPSGLSDRLGGGDVNLDAVDFAGSPSIAESFDLAAGDFDRRTRRFSRATLTR